jgi:hypothetical protein
MDNPIKSRETLAKLGLENLVDAYEQISDGFFWIGDDGKLARKATGEMVGAAVMDSLLQDIKDPRGGAIFIKDILRTGPKEIDDETAKMADEAGVNLDTAAKRSFLKNVESLMNKTTTTFAGKNWLQIINTAIQQAIAQNPDFLRQASRQVKSFQTQQPPPVGGMPQQPQMRIAPPEAGQPFTNIPPSQGTGTTGPEKRESFKVYLKKRLNERKSNKVFLKS